jgi:hypothetical protein
MPTTLIPLVRPVPRRIALALGLIALSSCRSLSTRTAPSAELLPSHVEALRAAGRVDSVLAPLRVAEGAWAYTLVEAKGPQRSAVLELDLRCNALVASKGAATAVGRRTTSALLAAQPASARAIAAINADFFLFAPPGVLTNAHIEHGRVIAGPDNKPVVWVDAAGAVHVDTLRARGTLRGPSGSLQLNAWNRPALRNMGIVDARWGVPLDTAVRRRVFRLEPVGEPEDGAATRRGRYVVSRGRPGDTLVFGDTLLLHVVPQTQWAVQMGDTLTLDMAVRALPVSRDSAGVGAVRDKRHDVQHAAAGRPILVRDSVLTADVHTEGNAGFRGPNPRSALGISRDGRRAWLVVMDGRQPARSVGSSLEQTGELLRMLGATTAINLDGGGSSALVVRDPASGAGQLRNRPSDPSERPVGNALIVTSRCGY